MSAPCVPCVAKPRMRKPLPVSPWSMLLATTPGTRRNMLEMSRPILIVASSSAVTTDTAAGRPALSVVTTPRWSCGRSSCVATTLTCGSTACPVSAVAAWLRTPDASGNSAQARARAVPVYSLLCMKPCGSANGSRCGHRAGRTNPDVRKPPACNGAGAESDVKGAWRRGGQPAARGSAGGARKVGGDRKRVRHGGAATSTGRVRESKRRITPSSCAAMAIPRKRYSLGEHHRQSHSVSPSAGARLVSTAPEASDVSAAAVADGLAIITCPPGSGTACTCVATAHACTKTSRSTAQARRTRFAC
ncbi:hypothetical protein CBM2634_B170146 [Cupriavidus taiwanensis]|uniref:Uncharacterized protein n=1 Tax=Cupriavidus taiwanensis TaxID=164546 RepID=A0A375J7H0_9BURK|nr:hypothetical protein CBM2634_B170146 [Cupriavidus taiwanensis]